MKLEINPIEKQDAGSIANAEDLSLQNETAAKASELIKRGISAAKSGNRHEARVLLLRVTEADSKNETAWLWLASISEYPEELLVFLQNVLAINPKNQRALDWTKQTKTLLAKNFVQRGIAASQDNQKDAARQSFLQAIVNDNQNEMAWLWLASIVDSAEEKMSHLQKVLAINPENSSAIASLKSIRNQIGMNLLKKANYAFVSGDRKRAKSLVEQTIKSDDSIEDAWILKAHLADSFDEKVLHFKRVLDANPNNQAAQSGLMSVQSVMRSFTAETEAPEAEFTESNEVGETVNEIVENIEAAQENQAERELETETETTGETLEFEEQETELAEQHFVDEEVVEYQEPEGEEPAEAELQAAPGEEVITETHSVDDEEAELQAAPDEEAKNEIHAVDEGNVELQAAPDEEETKEIHAADDNEAVEARSSEVESQDTEQTSPADEPAQEMIAENSPELVATESFDEESEPTGNADVSEAENVGFAFVSEEVEAQATEKEAEEGIQDQDPAVESAENVELLETSPEATETNDETSEESLESVAANEELVSSEESIVETSEESALDFAAEEEEPQASETAEVEAMEASHYEPEIEQALSEDLLTETAEAESEEPNESHHEETTQNSQEFAVHEEILDIKPVQRDNGQVGVYSFSKFGYSESHETDEPVEMNESETAIATEHQHPVETAHVDAAPVEAQQQEAADLKAKADQAVQTFEEYHSGQHFTHSDVVSQESATTEEAKAEFVHKGTVESETKAEVVYEYMSECPFCDTENEVDFHVCVGCNATLDMSDLESILENPKLNSELVFQAIQSMELDKLDGEFNDESFAELGMAYLNVKDLKNAYENLKMSLHLNPMNVGLNTLVKQIALKIEATENQKAEEIVEVKSESRTIMVVDDSPTVRKLISSKLERHGHTVVSAIDGMDALAKINEVTPDLILLDITMPKLDGYQVCKLIRNNDATKGIPVIMISGKDGFFDKVRGKMAGSNGFISKPFGPEILMKTLATFTR